MASTSDSKDVSKQPGHSISEACQDNYCNEDDELNSDDDIFSMSTQPLENTDNQSSIYDDETQVISGSTMVTALSRIETYKEGYSLSNKNPTSEVQSEYFTPPTSVTNPKVLTGSCVQSSDNISTPPASKQGTKPQITENHTATTYKRHLGLYLSSTGHVSQQKGSVKSDDKVPAKDECDLTQRLDDSVFDRTINTPVGRANKGSSVLPSSTFANVSIQFTINDSDLSVASSASPVLFEATPDDCDASAKKWDMSEAETQLFTPPRLLRRNHQITAVLPTPMHQMISSEDNFKYCASDTTVGNGDISEAETQLFALSPPPKKKTPNQIGVPLDISEAETQLFASPPMKRPLCVKQLLPPSSGVKTSDLSEAETQLFVPSPSKILNVDNEAPSVVSSGNTNRNLSVASQETLPMSPVEDDPETSVVDPDDEDSTDNYSQTQKLTVANEDEDSYDKYPATQRLQFHQDLSEAETQMIVNPDDEDSYDKYPATQRLPFPQDPSEAETQIIQNPDDEDSYNKYPATQKLQIHQDPSEAETQRIEIPEDEDSYDKYPATQKLPPPQDPSEAETQIIDNPDDEDSYDKYPATQKLPSPKDPSEAETQRIEIRDDEDSTDNYAPTQKLIIGENPSKPEDEDSTDKYPPTQRLILPGVHPPNPAPDQDEDSTDNYPETQKLILPAYSSPKKQKPNVFDSESDHDTYPSSPILDLGGSPTSGPDPELSASPILDLGSLSPVQPVEIPQLDDRDGSGSTKRSRSQVKQMFPMLCQSSQPTSDSQKSTDHNQNQELAESDSMVLETQLMSPVFVYVQTSQPQDQSQGSSHSKDDPNVNVEPMEIVLSSTPNERDKGDKVIVGKTSLPGRNIIRKSDLLSGGRAPPGRNRSPAKTPCPKSESWESSDSDFELSFAVPEPFVGFTVKDVSSTSKSLLRIQEAINHDQSLLDDMRVVQLPYGTDYEEEEPAIVEVKVEPPEVKRPRGRPKRSNVTPTPVAAAPPPAAAPAQVKREVGTRSRGLLRGQSLPAVQVKQEFKTPRGRGAGRQVTKSSSSRKTTGSDVTNCSDVLSDYSVSSMSDAEKPADSGAATTVKKKRGRPPKKLSTVNHQPDDASTSTFVPVQVKQEPRDVSRCSSVSSLDNSPGPVSQSAGGGRKRSRTAVPRTSSSSTTATTESSSRRRKKRPLAGLVRVLFTGFDDESDRLTVLKLGGQVVDTSKHCSVLVTDKIRRTVKFLCAVGLGVPIVGPNWLEASLLNGKFVDPWLHILQDKEGEKKFNFNLSKSLLSAGEKPFLSGWIFHATPHVLPPPIQMQEIVESCGGFYVEEIDDKSVDSKVVISSLQDQSSWKLWREKKVKLVSAEAILLGVLQQQFEPENFKL